MSQNFSLDILRLGRQEGEVHLQEQERKRAREQTSKMDNPLDFLGEGKLKEIVGTIESHSKETKKTFDNSKVTIRSFVEVQPGEGEGPWCAASKNELPKVLVKNMERMAYLTEGGGRPDGRGCFSFSLSRNMLWGVGGVGGARGARGLGGV